MQNALPSPETIDSASQRLIEFSVIGAAFVLVFIFSAALVWWVLRVAALEIRSAREELSRVNEARARMASEGTWVDAEIIDRQDCTISLVSRVLNILLKREGQRNDPMASE